MARYRIVCTNQEPVHRPPTHAHIVAVGTGQDADHADNKWTLDEVLAAMDRGHTFYTRGSRTGREASVEKYRCTPCARIYIRSVPDAIPDNNLDNLRICKWKS